MRHFPESVDQSKLATVLENGVVLAVKRLDILLVLDEYGKGSVSLSVSMWVTNIPFGEERRREREERGIYVWGGSH